MFFLFLQYVFTFCPFYNMSFLFFLPRANILGQLEQDQMGPHPTEKTMWSPEMNYAHTGAHPHWEQCRLYRCQASAKRIIQESKTTDKTAREKQNTERKGEKSNCNTARWKLAHQRALQKFAGTIPTAKKKVCSKEDASVCIRSVSMSDSVAFIGWVHRARIS